jgi:hypothetical protein
MCKGEHKSIVRMFVWDRDNPIENKWKQIIKSNFQSTQVNMLNPQFGTWIPLGLITFLKKKKLFYLYDN